MGADGKRAMGLDYGDKTIGVALGDPLGIIASGLETIRRPNPDDLKSSLARLGEIIRSYNVGEIVLGYPRNMNNTEGPRCEKTLTLKKRLEREFAGLRVILWDERLSTKAALRPLAGASPGKKKSLADTLSAVYILQSYIEYKREPHRRRRRAAHSRTPAKYASKLARLVRCRRENNLNEVDALDKNDNVNFDGEFDDLEEEEYEIITLLDDDDEEVSFAVIDAREVNGVTYLLVLEEEDLGDDTADASILKGVMVEGEDEIVYEFVEDDKEFNFAAGLFDEENEDFDIE